MFDLPPPLQCRGIEAYEQTWDLLFRYHKTGTAFDFRELAVTASTDVAFAVAIMWCGPQLVQQSYGQGRLSVPANNRIAQSRWRVAHRTRTSLGAVGGLGLRFRGETNMSWQAQKYMRAHLFGEDAGGLKPAIATTGAV